MNDYERGGGWKRKWQETEREIGNEVRRERNCVSRLLLLLLLLKKYLKTTTDWYICNKITFTYQINTISINNIYIFESRSSIWKRKFYKMLLYETETAVHFLSKNTSNEKFSRRQGGKDKCNMWWSVYSWEIWS